MRIACLSAHPEHVDALAAAHVDAFGALQPGWDAATAAGELRMHGRGALPLTLLALDEADDWLGSVSLLHEDHPDIHQYTPWLASLYVRPQARAGGLGAHLAAQAVARAAELRYDVLHLYCTEDLRGFYARLGWEACDRIGLGALQVWVMRIACTARAHRTAPSAAGDERGRKKAPARPMTQGGGRPAGPAFQESR